MSEDKNKLVKQENTKPEGYTFGRPTKYKPEYCQQIIEYFSKEKFSTIVKFEMTGKNDFHKTEYQRVANELPTFTKFAREIGVNIDTLIEWTKKYPDFSESYSYARDLLEEFLVNNALWGLYPSNTFIFVAKNLTRFRDKKEVELSQTLPEQDKESFVTELVERARQRMLEAESNQEPEKVIEGECVVRNDDKTE